MTKVYINYPNPRIRVYTNPNSAQIGKHQKAGQRNIKLDMHTISNELTKFTSGHYKFGSNPDVNDMWLDIDFDDLKFESELVKHLQKVIGNFHIPLSPGRITIEQA